MPDYPSSNLQTYECYACGQRFRNPDNWHDVFLQDDGHRSVMVGPECFTRVLKAGPAGYAPPRGGPRLFIEKRFAEAFANDASA